MKCEKCGGIVSAVARIDGEWASDDIRRAFVEGAAWCEYHRSGATMWPSDRRLAEAEAEKRFAHSAIGALSMPRDLVIAIRTYVQLKRDKQDAMGLDHGATDLLLSRIDAAMNAADRSSAK